MSFNPFGSRNARRREIDATNEATQISRAHQDVPNPISFASFEVLPAKMDVGERKLISLPPSLNNNFRSFFVSVFANAHSPD